MQREEPGNEATELKTRNTADHKREGEEGGFTETDHKREGGRRGVSLKQTIREKGGRRGFH